MAQKQEPIKGRVERAPHYLWKQRPKVDLKYDTNVAIRAQYEKAAEQQRLAEEHAERSETARRRIRIRQQKARSQRRKVKNYENEIELGIETFGREAPRPPSVNLKEPKHKPAKKDHYYYRRTGFIWTDLVHTPVERTPFAIPPASIIGDVKALEYIVKELEKEDAIVESKEKLILERAATMREKSQIKSLNTKFKSRALRARTLASAVEERRELREQLALQEQLEYEGLTVNEPRRLAQLAGHLPEQDCSAYSPRSNNLALPKRHYKKKELFMNVGTGDIRGLLVTDPALRKHISHAQTYAAEKINDPAFAERISNILPHTISSVLNRLEKNKPGPPSGQKSSGANESPRRKSQNTQVDPLQVLENAGYKIGSNAQDARAIAVAIAANAKEENLGGMPGFHHRGGAQQQGEGPPGTMGLLALNQPSHFGGEEIGDDWRLWSNIESRTSLDTGFGAGQDAEGSVGSTATYALLREQHNESSSTLHTYNSLRQQQKSDQTKK